MNQLQEPRMLRRASPPEPDEAPIEQRHPAGESRPATLLRALGALSVLAVGTVHLEQYFAVHFDVIPVIGPLFALNFTGAVLIALGLLLPLGRLRILFALAGIGLALTSAVFFFISEHQPLFGFEEYGYRTAILIALAAEAAAVLSHGGYLTVRARHR